MLLGSCWRVTLLSGTMRTPWGLPCGTKLLREFILRISDFFCVLRELIFATRTNWFFLLGIDFCVFRKYPVPSIDNILVLLNSNVQ